MLDEHAPFQRIISDQATATDRQWLRMLNDVMSDLSFDVFVSAGMDARAATNLLGLVALTVRQNREESSE